MNINIIVSPTPLLYDMHICSIFHEQYMTNTFKFVKYFTNIQKRNSIILLLNKYEYVLPNTFGRFTNNTTICTNNKLYTIKNVIGKNKDIQSIILYNPHTYSFFFNYEIIKKFNLLNHSQCDILEISHNPSFFEACEYAKKK